MLKRLRLKTVCINMVLVTTILCVMFGLILQLTRYNLDAESQQMVQFLAKRQQRPGRFDGPDRPVQLPYVVADLSFSGKVTAWGYFDDSQMDILGMVSLVQESDQEEGVLEDYALRYCRSSTPMGTRYVFLDISSQQNTFHNLVKSCVIIGFVAFFLFLGLSFVLAGWAIKPVEQAWHQQRQFVADASHELKTPLTVILTNAELLQAPEYGEDAKLQFSDHILTMARQMRGLVEDLLELARVDNGLSRVAYSSLDWSRLVSDAVLPFEPVYFEHSLELETRIQPGLTLKGDEHRLRQVVEILLDNALKYSTPNRTVTLELTRQGRTHALLAVSSFGDTMSAQELTDIFKRFYRGDKVRSMSHSYGLGLPIAKGIVEQHDGRIWAESDHNRNTFYVNLPLIS